MANHGEIRVGSVGEWVVRDGGSDVRVAVLSKQRAESGRGYDFVVQRVDGQGQAYGRKLTRGSGSLRRPGTAARAFGGGAPARATRNPVRGSSAIYGDDDYDDYGEPSPAIMPMWPEAAPRRSAPRRAAVPRRPSAESHLTASGRVTWVQPAIAPYPSSALSTGSSAVPPALPSLRGRGRSSVSSPKTAPARPVAPAPTPTPGPSLLVRRVIEALTKLPPHADGHMIRGAVAEVLAIDSSSHYYGLSPRR